MTKLNYLDYNRTLSSFCSAMLKEHLLLLLSDPFFDPGWLLYQVKLHNHDYLHGILHHHSAVRNTFPFRAEELCWPVHNCVPIPFLGLTFRMDCFYSADLHLRKYFVCRLLCGPLRSIADRIKYKSTILTRS